MESLLTHHLHLLLCGLPESENMRSPSSDFPLLLKEHLNNNTSHLSPPTAQQWMPKCQLCHREVLSHWTTIPKWVSGREGVRVKRRAVNVLYFFCECWGRLRQAEVITTDLLYLSSCHIYSCRDHFQFCLYFVVGNEITSLMTWTTYIGTLVETTLWDLNLPEPELEMNTKHTEKAIFCLPIEYSHQQQRLLGM